MKTYQITFEWPSSDWTWINIQARDFHQAMLLSLNECPSTCRVIRIEFLTPTQAKYNTEYMNRNPRVVR